MSQRMCDATVVSQMAGGDHEDTASPVRPPGVQVECSVQDAAFLNYQEHALGTNAELHTFV